MNACKLLGGISRKNFLTFFAVALALATTLFSQTGPRASRLTGEVSAGATVAMAGTVHPLTRRATDLGAVNPAMRMESLTLNTSLDAAGQTELATLLEAQQNAKSPQHHQWLTQEEYGARFGLTEADLNAVTGWLKQQGFTVTGVSQSRNAIYFGGTAGQVERAFETQLHNYELDGEQHFANATELRIPVELAGVVQSVRGLDNFRPKSNLHKIAVTPDFTYSTTEHFLAPGDWATIYNLNPIYSAGYDGTGIHVGVVGQTYVEESEINNFSEAAGTWLWGPKLTYVCISTADCAVLKGISLGDWVEADLDIEWAGGIARKAMVDYVYAAGDDTSQNVFDALQYAIQSYKSSSGLVLPVISMSYTACETSLPLAQAKLFASIGMQANAQGQTLVVSSGDSGAAGCDAHGSSAVLTAVNGISAEAPVDSPNFTGVGGTQFSGDVSDPNLYWNQVADTLDSALSYIPETSWNETGTNGLIASGGGQSTLRNGSVLEFPLPSWQSGLISGATGRMSPDVAFSAAEHDGYMGCSDYFDGSKYGSMCTYGFYSSGGGDGSVFYSFFGTSLATPSFAGMLGMMVQSLGPLGNINPTLYKLAANAESYKTIFHDVTTGNNDVPCQAGTSGCVDGVMGYAAKTGYDMVTGLGSIDGAALFVALGGSNLRTTSTTVAVSPNPVRLGDILMLTAQVTSIVAGTPTGNVVFKVGSKNLGTAAVSGGTAILSNVAMSAANGFSNGTNTITASYSGDANYGASSGTTQLTGSVAPFATSITVYEGPSPVLFGYTISIFTHLFPATFGLTPTGSVTFTVNGTNFATVVLSNGGVPDLDNVLVSTANGFSNGTDTITATYNGDSNFAASSGSTTLTVSGARFPTVTLAGTPPAPVKEGGTVAMAAYVSTVDPGMPTGTVTFATGTALLGTVQYVDNPATLSGVVATEANGLGYGTDTVTVSYSGDANFLPSSASVLVTVYDTVFPLLLTDGLDSTEVGNWFQAILSGENFTTGSVALWNGAARPTAYVSDTTLGITVYADDVEQEGTYLITVANPSPNAGTSAGQPIAVELFSPVAKISSASIGLAGDGSGNYVLALRGTDFWYYGPVVQWNGASLPTSSVSPWQVSASLTPAQYASRPATVTVVNLDPTTTSAPFMVY